MITPQEIIGKAFSEKFNPDEIEAYDGLEKYFDERIEDTFDGKKASVIEPPLYSNEKIREYNSLKSHRKEIVLQSLLVKYAENGWDWKIEYGEDDGPNRPGYDYYIFTPKIK